MNEKEHEDLVDMFASPGWKLFIKGATELEDTLVRVAPDAADTNDKWQFARGQIYQLRRIVGYEDYVVLSQEMEQAALIAEGTDDADTV